MPDRFSENPLSLKQYSRRLWDEEEPKCECRMTGDFADASHCPRHGEPCHFCGLLGGSPFLMTADGLACSRCFEDFTPQQFHDWLADQPQQLEVVNDDCEREWLVKQAQEYVPRKPIEIQHQPQRRKVA